MTVVKFSILTLLAGGFCTLLGIGMWMGPQETPCNAQTGVTAVAVADSPAPIKSCWSQPSDVQFRVGVVATEAMRGGGPCSLPPSDACESGACDSAACEAPACSSGKCKSGPCNLTSTEPSACPTATPAHPVVQRLPSPYYAVDSWSAPCESGVCAPGAYPTAAPCSAGTVCPPGVPCPPAPTYATTSFYHVAPCAGPEVPTPAYSNPYGVAPAYVTPAPVVSAYASYREVEPRTSDEPSMEMIEAFMEEREKRYEAQIEALEAQMELHAEMIQSHLELKLEAQAATLQAQHQVELTQLKAEAMVKFATMEQALREEKALLHLVADGTLTTDALRSIIAKNRANGHESSVQPVSTAAGCACEKCGCETCKCGQPDASCACTECDCEGCACPGCEQAVTVEASACPACKTCPCGTSGCETKACEASACTTSAGAKGEGCKSCDSIAAVNVQCVDDGCPACENAVSTSAPTCSSCKTTACEAPVCTTAVCVKREACVTACANCVKSCEACAMACDACTSESKSLERTGVEFDFEGERCTILSNGIPMAILGDGCTMTTQDLAVIGATQGREGDYTIVFGQKAADCAKGECKTVEFRMGKKSVAVETPEAPFVCEKDGCEVEFQVTAEAPFLSKIPYLGRLFKNAQGEAPTEEEAAPAEEDQR